MRDAFDVIPPGAQVAVLGTPSAEQMEMLNGANAGSNERIGYLSDIHGQHELFEAALEVLFGRLGCSKVIVVGDSVDRSLNIEGGLKVLQTIYDLGNKAVLLGGNHDRDNAIQIYNYEGWIDYRDEHNLQDSKLAQLLQEDENAHLAEMIKNLPLYYEDDKVFAVHGGLRDGSVEKTKKELNEVSTGEHGYCVAPIPLIEGGNDQEDWAEDSDKIIVTGHMHMQTQTADMTRGFVRRIRIGSLTGMLRMFSVKDNQYTLSAIQERDGKILSA